MPRNSLCPVCVAREGLYAWCDQKGVIVSKGDGTPYPIMSRGCGGCGKCDACRRSLCCDGSLVAHVFVGDHFYPVHLLCLAREALCVDYAPTARALCAISGEKIKLSELRLAVVLPKHNGLADRAFTCRLHAAREFLRALRAVPELEHFDVADVRGVAELAPEHRDWALAALRGEGGPPSPPPTAARALRAYTGLEGSENYPMHCTGCRPAKEARKPEAGQKKISAFFKKPGA